MTVSARASPHARSVRRSAAMLPARLPLFAAALVAVGSYVWEVYPSGLGRPDGIAIGGTIASVGSTMLGFTLAALAVVASISHTHLVRMMQRTGHFADLLKTLFVGGAFFMGCALLGFALVFGVPATSGVLILSNALHAGALVALLDTGRKFWFVLTNIRAD
jgi:hypothetical protein